VYGDAPYGTSNADTAEFDATPAFIDAINHDPKVDLVAHVGDIHSGSQRCTFAYDQSIAQLWTAYKDPLIYTPGDNEWSDCQKTKELGGLPPSASYANADPVANLALVRQLFFPDPGSTLGGRNKQVVSQAQIGSGTDANYVENVMWEQSKTLFFTLNLPGGSNDDADIWFGAASPTQAQLDERAQRDQADLDWINAAFDQAEADRVGSVVILTQADMWDTTDTPAHQSNYTQFISAIAQRTLSFGAPVLLINGDSHLYRSDNPLEAGAPCVAEATPHTTAIACAKDAWNQHPGFDVANFHRIVVHGSTPVPLEYLRLTDDPRASNPTTDSSFGPFSWERVVPNP
jgi:hypothetical protein